MLRTSKLFLQRHTGICREWQIAKGFGFVIDNADKKSVFAHVSGITASVNPYKALTVGERYEFDLETDEKRNSLKCERITAVGGGPVEGSDDAPPPHRPYVGDNPRPYQ